jgi:hypothetical protein
MISILTKKNTFTKVITIICSSRDANVILFQDINCSILSELIKIICQVLCVYLNCYILMSDFYDEQTNTKFILA